MIAIVEKYSIGHAARVIAVILILVALVLALDLLIDGPSYTVGSLLAVVKFRERSDTGEWQSISGIYGNTGDDLRKSGLS